MRIAVLGLGNMGKVVAATLARDGREVIGWNRTVREAPAGVTLAPDLATAVRKADLLLLVSSTYDSTYDMLRPVEGSLAGKTLVNFNCGLPKEAETFAAWATAAGARWDDAAIMAYPLDVGSDRALFLHACEPSIFAEIAPLLAPLGPRHRHAGSAPGACKVLFNVLIARNYAWMMSYLQAAAIARASGVDTTVFTDIAMDLLGPLFGNIQRAKAEIAAGDFGPAKLAALAVHHQAAAAALEMATDVGARTPILSAVVGAMQQGIDSGLGDQEIAACFTTFLPR